MDLSNYQMYNTTINSYNLSGPVIVEKLCNGFTAINIGDTIAEVNGIPLFPSATPLTVVGDALAVGGNDGEIYKGNINLLFRVPLGAAPSVLIVQKFFVTHPIKKTM